MAKHGVSAKWAAIRPLDDRMDCHVRDFHAGQVLTPELLRAFVELAARVAVLEERKRMMRVLKAYGGPAGRAVLRALLAAEAAEELGGEL